MNSSRSRRALVLLQREMRQHRRAFFWAPLLVSTLLAAGMLLSLVMIDRISVFGDTLVQVIEKQVGSGGAPIVVIRGERVMRGEAGSPSESESAEELPARPATPGMPESAWDFARDWDFSAPPGRDRAAGPSGDPAPAVSGLNPLLNALHNILLLVLMITLSQYLLGALYDDRKDRSILFWRSLPVSEWETVLSKLGVALIVAPGVLIGISIILQAVTTLLAMLMVWRLDLQPMAVLMDNLDLGRLLVDQVGGWLLSALWLAPVCAWLLLASAAARRSPFLLAVTPVLGAILVETLFFRSSLVVDVVGRHLPRLSDNESGVVFYLFGPDWRAIDWVALSGGLVFATVATALAVYLRRHRWEI